MSSEKVNVKKYVWKLYKKISREECCLRIIILKWKMIIRKQLIIKRYESGLSAENKIFLKRKVTKSKNNQFDAYFENNPKQPLKPKNSKFQPHTLIEC